MFRVVTRNSSQTFERWTDALNTAKSLQPQCKSWLEDIRIFDEEDLVWVYSKSHKYPQYVGPGSYNRLALLFLQEAIEDEVVEDKVIEDEAALGNASETNPSKTNPVDE